jgi:hypothetical protein
LRRCRLIGKRQNAETQSAEAQNARRECKTHRYLLKGPITQQTSIATACRRSDEASMKLR